MSMTQEPRVAASVSSRDPNTQIGSALSKSRRRDGKRPRRPL